MSNVPGYTANTFTAGEQPTTSVWNELWGNDAAFNAILGPAFPVNTVYRAWQYMTSTYTINGFNMTGTTPTAWPSMTLPVTAPAGYSQIRISLTARDAFNSSGGDNEIQIYRGSTSGALTNLIGGIQVNLSAGQSEAINMFVLDSSATAGSAYYYTVALVAMSSGATLTAEASASAPAVLVADVC